MTAVPTSPFFNPPLDFRGLRDTDNVIDVERDYGCVPIKGFGNDQYDNSDRLNALFEELGKESLRKVVFFPGRGYMIKDTLHIGTSAEEQARTARYTGNRSGHAIVGGGGMVGVSSELQIEYTPTTRANWNETFNYGGPAARLVWGDNTVAGAAKSMVKYRGFGLLWDGLTLQGVHDIDGLTNTIKREQNKPKGLLVLGNPSNNIANEGGIADGEIGARIFMGLGKICAPRIATLDCTTGVQMGENEDDNHADSSLFGWWWCEGCDVGYHQVNSQAVGNQIVHMRNNRTINPIRMSYAADMNVGYMDVGSVTRWNPDTEENESQTPVFISFDGSAGIGTAAANFTCTYADVDGSAEDYVLVDMEDGFSGAVHVNILSGQGPHINRPTLFARLNENSTLNLNNWHGLWDDSIEANSITGSFGGGSNILQAPTLNMVNCRFQDAGAGNSYTGGAQPVSAMLKSGSENQCNINRTNCFMHASTPLDDEKLAATA